MDAWEEEATKIGGKNLVEKLTEMANNINALARNADLAEDRMREAEMAIQKLYTAFPAGDVEGHRRYHDLIIENTEETRRLRTAIREKTLSGLIWAVIVGISIMIWTGFLQIIGK